MYQWLLAFHIIAVIAWMAGMLYLPRLFVYHCDGRSGLHAVGNLQGDGAAAAQGDHQPGDDCDLGAGLVARLARRLVRGALAARQARAGAGDEGVHGILSKYVREFAADKRRKSAKFFRILNEVPTVLMILIVILAVVKPF